MGARVDSFCPGDSAAAALRKWRVRPRAWAALCRPPALRGLAGPALPPCPRRGAKAAACPLGGTGLGACRRLSVRWSGVPGAVDSVPPLTASCGRWQGPGATRALGALWPGHGARKRSVSSGRPWRNQRVRADRGELGRPGESGVWVGSAANFPPPCCCGHAAAGQAGRHPRAHGPPAW